MGSLLGALGARDECTLSIHEAPGLIFSALPQQMQSGSGECRGWGGGGFGKFPCCRSMTIL